MKKLIYRGAEADVFSGDWAGAPAIFKERKSLPYRLPELDREIRAQRTIHEALMIREARAAGASVPHLYYVSPAESLIVMEEVRGKRLKSCLEPGRARELARRFGMSVANLHRAGIMHGDLTTSNVIVGQGEDGVADEISLIDFGLATHSQKVEDHAVDLRLIKETLVGAHSEVSRDAMDAFVSGYREVLGEKRSQEVVKKLGEIERRGRYARVE